MHDKASLKILYWYVQSASNIFVYFSSGGVPESNFFKKPHLLPPGFIKSISVFAKRYAFFYVAETRQISGPLGARKFAP